MATAHLHEAGRLPSIKANMGYLGFAIAGAITIVVGNLKGQKYKKDRNGYVLYALY